MLVDMVHDNHGEPAFKTRFRDPALLKSYGYDGIVIPDALAAVPSAFRGVALNTGQQQTGARLQAAIDEKVEEATAAGLNVFFYSDALMLPAVLVQSHPEAYLCADGTNRLCPGRPAVFEGIAALASELFSQWPRAAGLIMRTSEAYPESLPHLLGNPLQTPACPVCRSIPLVERLAQFIAAMYRAVVLEQDKLYIHRAWQNTAAPSIHDSPAMYRELMARLPEHPRLLLSFKFTAGDFWHGRPSNPCITADARPKWVEFPSAREFEGKGAFPNFQAAPWAASGVLALPRETLACAWGTSRGAGWGGPYLQREEWLDANVYALGRLAANPALAPADIARDWAAQTFQLPADSAPAGAIATMLLLSAEVAGALLYVPALADLRRTGATMQPILHDDLLDIETLWLSAQQVAETDEAPAIYEQKIKAVENVGQMRRLFDTAAASLPNRAQARDLAGTLAFYESFAGTVGHVYCGFLRYWQWQRGGQSNAVLATQAENHLQHAQAYWQHHSQRHAMLPGAPSVFNESSLWERTNSCLEKLSGVDLNLR